MITQEQYWKTAQYILEQYSADTMEKVTDLMYSPEAVEKLYQIILTKPTEQEFLTKLGKLE